jgi:hypothetical protein
MNIIKELKELYQRVLWIEEFIGVAPISQPQLLEQFRFLEGEQLCNKENFEKLFKNVLLQLNHLETELQRLKNKLNEVITYL